MLESLRFHRFLGRGDLHVPLLGDVSLVVGAHGSGKTSLLRALAGDSRLPSRPHVVDAMCPSEIWDVAPGCTPHVLEIVATATRSAFQVPVSRVENFEAAHDFLVTLDDDSQVSTRALGSGAWRFATVVAAVGAAQATSGIALVDDLGAGTHWSVQSALWDAIFRIADELGVQVVATTHNRDCVSAFSAAATQRRDVRALLHHLGRSARDSNRGDVVATTYDADVLELAIRAEIEVR